MLHPQPVSPNYQDALVFSGILQLLLQFFAALTFDGGVLLFVNTLAIGAFWIVAAFIFFRRPAGPSPRDARILRLGYPLLLCHVGVLVMLTWKWQGRL
ncbi:hypothetical protein [Haloferula sp. BvORR071]|uniref:hypothetical protein n=1 Tax=Haloferula sp. BvORR071 TaxID=1396141 RepID=UPI002240EC98|nr:hypothetical protein [Haloferula sp. BvORR071]